MIFVLIGFCIFSAEAMMPTGPIVLPGMNRASYNQLVDFLARADPVTEATMISAVRNSQMWIKLNAEFGGSK